VEEVTVTGPGPGKPAQHEWPVRARSLWPRLLVSLLIAGGLFWALRKGGLPMFPPVEAFGQLDLASVALFVPMCLVATLLRTYRWIYLLRPINPRLSALRTLGVGSVGFAAIMFAPLRMGEVVRPWLLAQDREVFFVQAAGTVVAERIVDGLLLTSILAVGLLMAVPLSPLPTQLGNLQLPVALVPAIATSAFLTFVGAFVAMALFYFWRATAHRIAFAVIGLVSKPLATWVTQQVERLADSLQFLLSRKHGLAFIRDTVAYWAITVLSLWVLMRGAGAPATLAQAAVTMGVLGLSTLLPSGPGFFGTYQLGAYCGLSMFFPESVVLSSGAVFTFVSYTSQLTMALVFLLLGLAIMGRTAPGPALNARGEGDSGT
jgi:glycosyltransferase 2 family protein